MIVLFFSTFLALGSDPHGETSRVEKAIRSTQRMIQTVYHIGDEQKFSDPKKAFDHYLTLRLASFSADHRANVYEFLKTKVRVKQMSKELLSYGWVTNGAYVDWMASQGKNFIEVELKDLRLRGSWVYYSTLTHELEHHLQNLILNQEPERMKAYEKWRPDSTYSKELKSQYQLVDFFTEIGAMMAEHHYLQLMSRSILPSVKKRLKQLGVTPLGLDWRSLENINLNDSDFLKWEWIHRRYDLPNEFDRFQNVKFEDVLPSVTKIMSKEYCSRLLKASKKSPESE